MSRILLEMMTWITLLLFYHHRWPELRVSDHNLSGGRRFRDSFKYWKCLTQTYCLGRGGGMRLDATVLDADSSYCWMMEEEEKKNWNSVPNTMYVSKQCVARRKIVGLKRETGRWFQLAVMWNQRGRRRGRRRRRTVSNISSLNRVNYYWSHGCHGFFKHLMITTVRLTKPRI